MSSSVLSGQRMTLCHPGCRHTWLYLYGYRLPEKHKERDLEHIKYNEISVLFFFFTCKCK